MNTLQLIHQPRDERWHQRMSCRWQGFDTAPRSGEWFLAFTDYTVGWCDVSGVGPVRFACWDAETDSFIEGGGYTLDDKFTHWSPVPIMPPVAQRMLLDGASLQPIDETTVEDGL